MLMHDGKPLQDLAREMYRNATLEKISLLQHLYAREKVLDTQTSMWSNSISDLQNIVLSMETISEELTSFPGRFENRLQHSLDDIISSRQTAFDQYLTKIENRDIRRLQQAWKIILHIQFPKSLPQMNDSLARIWQLHAKELHALIPYFQVTMREQLEPVFADVQIVHGLLMQLKACNTLVELQKERRSITDQMNSLYETLSEIHKVIDVANVALQGLDQEVLELHYKQQNAMIVASEFHNSVASIAASVHTEMEKINNTAHSISLGQALFSRSSYPSLMEGFIYRVLPTLYPGHTNSS
ncbi:hypothetical protein AX17_004731 [Amanita inopinata Kibby_2008]|nr:hypothetical protein AX17_004731 [Amanita inopinata Kibby_2008]